MQNKPVSDKSVETISLELPVEDPDAQHGVQYARLVPIKRGSELLLYGGRNSYGKSELLIKASSQANTGEGLDAIAQIDS